VAQFGRLHISGFFAWVLWSVAHVYFLIGFRNRFIVALNWAWNYITFQRGSRLITGLYARQLDDVRQPARIEPRSKAS
jgi:NADH dehydrogenase